jgi:regulatory protein
MELFQTAIRLLARREHSRFELQQKLIQRGFTPNIVEPLLKQLLEKNLLSDKRFAENYIHYRTNKGYGPLRIAAELQHRGVDRDIIDELLDASSEEWIQKIQYLKQKRFGKKPPIHFNEQARQMRFFQYRGFTPDQIRKIFIEIEP